jgi:hypothetical protein
VKDFASRKFELLELDPFFDENGWRGARVAVDGVPSIPFQFHKTALDNCKTDEQLMAYLCRQGQAMIDQYGDSRFPKHIDGGVN